MKDKNNFGTTTLEALVGLLLLAPLLTIMTLALHNTVINYFRVALEHSQNGGALRVLNLLNGVLLDLDSHRLAIPPRIHRAGLITFTDGTLNQINLSTDHAPLSTSDAITGLKLDLVNSQIVKNTLDESNLTVFAACPRYAEGFKSALYRNYLGLSADGMVELQGTVTPSYMNPGCHDFMLSKTKSMSIPPSQLASEQTVRMLVPIIMQYTIYIDNAHGLRYLSHQGEQNIENQPIAKEFSALSLKSGEFTPSGIFELQGQVILKGGAEYTFAYDNSLARVAPLNLLLNRP